jgi:hypothetical protein
MASLCFTAGRIDEAVRYSDAAQIELGRSREPLPYSAEGMIGGAYITAGQPERWVEMCRTQLPRRRDTTLHIRACLVYALAFAGFGREAMAKATGLIEATEATDNSYMVSFTLGAYGFAFRDADPVRALDALRRGLVIAEDSGNRFVQSQLAVMLSRLEAEHGDPASALDCITLAIRNFHNSGNTTTMRGPLAVLAAFFDRLGRHEAAATIAGFAVSPLTTTGVFPEITTAIAHLGEVLGEQTYESLARKGQTMTTAVMVTFAYDQIDQARAELNAVWK